ncbi:MAG: hypothetical protein V8T36_00675, partial [Ruthenibacterium lactatiformans]
CLTIIHHLRKALFPAPAAQKHPAPNLYGQGRLQLVEKATLLRQAAYEQGFAAPFAAHGAGLF